MADRRIPPTRPWGRRWLAVGAAVVATALVGTALQAASGESETYPSTIAAGVDRQASTALPADPTAVPADSTPDSRGVTDKEVAPTSPAEGVGPAEGDEGRDEAETTSSPSKSEPSPTPSVDRAASTDVERAEEAADEAIADFYTRQEEALGPPQRDVYTASQVQDTVAGAALSELSARADEFQAEGLTQTGAVQILSVAVVDVDTESDPQVLTAEACIDISDVDVLDQDGQSLGDRLYRPDRPIREIYTLHWLDGTWKLVTHEVPIDDKCNPNR